MIEIQIHKVALFIILIFSYFQFLFTYLMFKFHDLEDELNKLNKME